MSRMAEAFGPYERVPFAVEPLVARATAPGCFICEYLKGNPDYEHVEVYRTEDVVVFLDRYPTVFGRVMVAPVGHHTQVTGDFDETAYLALQQLIFRVSEAMRAVLQPERIYILSLGSEAANAHVHWHIVPVPAGLPLAEQQFHTLMHEHGAVQVPKHDMARYAASLKAQLKLEHLGVREN
ncbi:MAG: HIT family protein [Pseudomonadota bacterium]